MCADTALSTAPGATRATRYARPSGVPRSAPPTAGSGPATVSRPPVPAVACSRRRNVFSPSGYTFSSSGGLPVTETAIGFRASAMSVFVRARPPGTIYGPRTGQGAIRHPGCGRSGSAPMRRHRQPLNAGRDPSEAGCRVPKRLSVGVSAMVRRCRRLQTSTS